MARIAMVYKHFPVSVAGFFKRAFLREGHEVVSVGPFYPIIPWDPAGDHTKDHDVPDIEQHEDPQFPGAAPLDDYLKDQLRERGVEAIVQFDAGWHLRGSWAAMPLVLVGTDPHCLDYTEQACNASHLFIMQKAYMDEKYAERGGKTDSWPVPQWLPFAQDPTIHYWIPEVEPEYDVVFVGVVYGNRRALLDSLRAAGLKVLVKTGALFEDGTELYAQGKIALNLSSRLDLPMRFYEGMAYRRMVLTNHVPDIDALVEGHGLVSGRHFVSYRSTYDPVRCEVIPDVDDVIDKARYYCHGGKWGGPATNGWIWVQPHTYDARVRKIMEAIGL